MATKPADKAYNQKSATVRKDRTVRTPKGNSTSNGKIFGNWYNKPSKAGGK